MDKHCVKQILESTQLLCTAYHEQGVGAPYKPSHRSHPSSIWTRASYDNFQWLIAHAHAIANEYTARYNKIHKSQAVLEWCEDHVHLLGFDSWDLTPFAIAIADDCECRKLPEFDVSDPVMCYRSYIKIDKKHIHAWKRNKPYWLE